DVQRLALALVEASLGTEGYLAVRTMMRINGFLGRVVDLESILGEMSYNIALFGTPHPEEPWGWQLFGHHCAVNCMVVDGRMVVSPVFLGAEPDVVDEGPHAGVETFGPRIELALELMSRLTPGEREQAVLFDHMVDPAMP